MSKTQVRADIAGSHATITLTTEGSVNVASTDVLHSLREAIAKVAGTILAGGANLAGCLIGPASKIASILKTIEENQSDEEAA